MIWNRDAAVCCYLAGLGYQINTEIDAKNIKLEWLCIKCSKQKNEKLFNAFVLGGSVWWCG